MNNMNELIKQAQANIQKAESGVPTGLEGDVLESDLVVRIIQMIQENPEAVCKLASEDAIIAEILQFIADPSQEERA